MKTSYLEDSALAVLDELILNLVGLRTQFFILPNEIISEILNRAHNDLIVIKEGVQNAGL